MKKFAMAAVAAAALSAGVAQAYTVGTYSNGFVVPNVIHNGDADTTAVGIVNNTGTTVPVFWTFFDANSNHITDGCFPMTNKDFEPFVWSQQAGTGLAGTRGYLVFAVGANSASTTAATACSVANATAGVAANGQIGASAFQVTTGTQDVAYVPVIDGPLVLATGSDLTVLGPQSVMRVVGARTVVSGAASNVTPAFALRYAVDNTPNAGLETRIVVWSTGDQRGTHTVNMYDSAQNRKSVNFALTEAELSFFNPETIPGRPANFADGFIEWTPLASQPADYPGAAGQSLFANATSSVGASIFTYSVISMPAFGAVQSILGTHN